MTDTTTDAQEAGEAFEAQQDAEVEPEPIPVPRGQVAVGTCPHCGQAIAMDKTDQILCVNERCCPPDVDPDTLTADQINEYRTAMHVFTFAEGNEWTAAVIDRYKADLKALDPRRARRKAAKA